MMPHDTSAPFMSIVIPVYNRSEDLVRALNSLVAQTQMNFEVIVVDDGSTENIKKVADRFYDLLNLQLIRIANSGGPARPRNVGVQAARGSWISFLDSDDWWAPGRIAEVCNTISKNPDYDVFYHKLRIVSDGIKRPWWSTKCLGWALRKNAFIDLMVRGNGIPNSSVVIRQTTYDRIGRFNESKEFSSVEDFDYWLRAALEDVDFYFIKKTLGSYWISSTGISTNTMWTISRNKLILDKYISYLPTNKQNFAVSKYNYFAASVLSNAGKNSEALEYFKQAKNLATFSLTLKRYYKTIRALLHRKNFGYFTKLFNRQ